MMGLLPTETKSVGVGSKNIANNDFLEEYERDMMSDSSMYSID